MQSLVVKISNPDTVDAIAEAAKRQAMKPLVQLFGARLFCKNSVEHGLSCIL